MTKRKARAPRHPSRTENEAKLLLKDGNQPSWHQVSSEGVHEHFLNHDFSAPVNDDDWKLFWIFAETKNGAEAEEMHSLPCLPFFAQRGTHAEQNWVTGHFCKF